MSQAAMKVCAVHCAERQHYPGTAPPLGRVEVCSAASLCLINEPCSAPGSDAAADAPAKLITLADLHMVRPAGQVPQHVDYKHDTLPLHLTTAGVLAATCGCLQVLRVVSMRPCACSPNLMVLTLQVHVAVEHCLLRLLSRTQTIQALQKQGVLAFVTATGAPASSFCVRTRTRRSASLLLKAQEKCSVEAVLCQRLCPVRPDNRYWSLRKRLHSRLVRSVGPFGGTESGVL